MAKQVMDMIPLKGIDKPLSNLLLRNRSESRWARATAEGNYDRTREHLNFEVVKGGIVQPVNKSYPVTKRFQDLMKRQKIKDPNEGQKHPGRRTACNIIFGGGNDRMRELAFGSQEVDFRKGMTNVGIVRMPEIEQWAIDIYNFACNEWGEDNIIAFIAHLDDTNPHVHCTVVPVDNRRNEISFRKVFVGEKNTREEYRMRNLALHDRLAKVNKKWGLDRGSNVKETGAKHITQEEYRHELRVRNNEGERTEKIRGEDLLLEVRKLKEASMKCYEQGTKIEDIRRSINRDFEDIELLNRLLDLMEDEPIESTRVMLNRIQKEVIEMQAKIEGGEAEIKKLYSQIRAGKACVLDAVDEMTADSECCQDDFLENVLAQAAVITAYEYRFLFDNAKSEEGWWNLIEEIEAKCTNSRDRLEMATAMLYIDETDGAIAACGDQAINQNAILFWTGRTAGENDSEYSKRCLRQAWRMIFG